ncbi:MAG: hypothetical protein ABIB71_08275 [Candidatus Woesearchaeota archaeon]
MTNINPPTIEELVKWHNQFGRLLEPNSKRTKLYGVDKKQVKYIERGPPSLIRVVSVPELGDDNQGYNHAERNDGSKSAFRFDSPDGWDVYLTYAECDLVLGTNYYLIDQGYSSPSPFIRKILFKAEASRADRYNAFEIGTPISGWKEVTVPIIYYRISQKRFRKLRGNKEYIKNNILENNKINP